MTDDNLNDSNESEVNVEVKYTFTLGNHLFKKIENNIHKLNYLDYDKKSKQQWITDAIREKFAHEEKKRAQTMPEEHNVTLRIHKVLNEKLEKRIESIKKKRRKNTRERSYSKKQWIEEAILDKLDRESEKIKQLELQSQKKPSKIRQP
jgi:hypothetical protein